MSVSCSSLRDNECMGVASFVWSTLMGGVWAICCIVWVCVCMREREGGEKGREREREGEQCVILWLAEAQELPSGSSHAASVCYVTLLFSHSFPACLSPSFIVSVLAHAELFFPLNPVGGGGRNRVPTPQSKHVTMQHTTPWKTILLVARSFSFELPASLTARENRFSFVLAQPPTITLSLSLSLERNVHFFFFFCGAVAGTCVVHRE